MPTTSRHRRGRLGWVVAIGLLAAGGCGPGRTAVAPTTVPTRVGATPTTQATIAAGTTAPTGTTLSTGGAGTSAATRAPAATTTVLPTARQPSPGAASTALIDDWEQARRAAAATVATTKAVAVLFGTPYAGQTLNDRGCSTSFQIVCTWGPYGGASPTDALYQISVTASGSSWYVSAVVVEG